MKHLDLLVQELCCQAEAEWLEFKMGNVDPKMIGQRISALANGACLRDRSKAYLVWGVEDQTHKIKGTDIRLKRDVRTRRTGELAQASIIRECRL